MSIGTFGSFTQARLAIYAAQSGLTVTGNNISNINTPGYTRQRLDQASLYTAGSDRYYSAGDVRIGQGVLVKSISQIRSPYLDIRFRKENAQMGYMDGKLDGLNKIAMILDEVGKGDASKDEDGFGVLGLEFSELFDALGQLTDQTGQQEYDSTVRQVASNLCAKFRSYANSLQTEYENVVQAFEENVKKVNSLLTNIRDLNVEIRKCDIHGDNALELRDERNVKIDELSKLVNIQVDYSMEEFSYGVEIEKLSIRLGNSNPDGGVETDSALLIDGIFSSQFILEQVPEARDPAELKKLQEADTLKTDKTIWPYMDANGNYTADKETGGVANTPNPDYEQYLTAKGTPTANPDEARQVNNPNFNLTVSELRNQDGRLLFDTNMTMKDVLLTSPADDVEIADLDAIFANLAGDTYTKEARDTPTEKDITTTTYRRVLKSNPDHLPYLDAAGKPTGVKTDTLNPAYFRYVKTVDGHPVYTNKADNDTQDNPQYGGRYLDAAGNPTADPAQAETFYYKTQVVQTASKSVELDDNDLYGELQAQRELLTEAGEFTNLDVITKDGGTGSYRCQDENAASKRGFPYYQKVLDLLANQFAKVMNDANQGFRTDPSGNYISPVVDANGKPVLDEITGRPTAKPITFTYPDPAGGADKTFTLNKNTKWDDIPQEVKDQMNGATSIEEYLKTGGGTDADGNPIPVGIFDGGVLFSNNNSGDDPTGITASNIDISYSWSNTNNYLVRDFECPQNEAEPASGKSENIRHLQNLLDSQQHDFVPSDLPGLDNVSGDIMFTGTFFQMWNKIGSTLGDDQDLTTDMLTAHYENVLEIDTSRDSVSAVDFNDEAMNLMMYAKSYNAACRLMTTIDSVLDKLVNNTGLTT
ncbi:MAG: hypothetical protein HFG02_06030 [Oscillibacter sp.]|nr:hypothetical protein [Oscillibacter sp.]